VHCGWGAQPGGKPGSSKQLQGESHSANSSGHVGAPQQLSQGLVQQQQQQQQHKGSPCKLAVWPASHVLGWAGLGWAHCALLLLLLIPPDLDAMKRQIWSVVRVSPNPRVPSKLYPYAPPSPPARARKWAVILKRSVHAAALAAQRPWQHRSALLRAVCRLLCLTQHRLHLRPPC
jgi:hypothetical protein